MRFIVALIVDPDDRDKANGIKPKVDYFITSQRKYDLLRKRFLKKSVELGHEIGG